MGQLVLRLADLPEAPLDAAARFHAEHVPRARNLLREGIDALAIVFPPGGKPHHGWQLAAVQALAREAAPKRVNGVVGGGSDTVDEATAWLAGAPGVTGQLLALDGKSVGIH